LSETLETENLCNKLAAAAAAAAATVPPAAPADHPSKRRLPAGKHHVTEGRLLLLLLLLLLLCPQRHGPPGRGNCAHKDREKRSGTMGDKGRQDPREGGRTIQQRETKWETRGDKTSGRRTHHPTPRRTP